MTDDHVYKHLLPGEELDALVSKVIFNKEHPTGTEWSQDNTLFWEIVQAMLDKGYDYEMGSRVDNRHHVRFNWLQDFEPSICNGVGEVSDAGSGHWFWGFTSTTPAHAVCIAALLAVSTNERPKTIGQDGWLKKKHLGEGE